MKKAAVIGSGIGGIAASIRLKAKGYEVDVFEKNAYPGGKLSEFWLGKYRFDAGPSLFTQPHYVKELFLLLGENPEENFDYIKLQDICHYFWEDGTRLTAYADHEKFANEIQTKLGESKESVFNYLNDSKHLYDLTEDLFIHSSFHKLKTFTSSNFLSKLPLIPKLKAFTTLHEENKRYFKNPKTVQLFDRYATYNGSSPYIAPGTLKLIPNLEYNLGAFLPKDGMFQITMSLVELAKRNGVKFNFNSPVDKILHRGGQVEGLQVSGEKLEYDIIVSNADVVVTYEHLLKDIKGPKRIYKQERSSSALVFNWGIKKVFPELGLHNILFSNQYKEEFEMIFRQKQMHDDPTVYIFISSKYIPTDAPNDSENWFVLINAPHIHGQDWNKMANQTRNSTIQKINRILGVDMEQYIEEEEILSPPLIQQKTSSYLGSLYGTSSNSKTAAFNRHPNFSRRFKNLYFVGGSVHPGGGIPLCLSSAKIAVNLIPDV